MIAVKVSEAQGIVLDWLVTRCQAAAVGVELNLDRFLHHHDLGSFEYSTDWAQGGPIIDSEGISWHCGNKSSWHAYAYGSADNFSGPTPIIAAMRCYVASKLGETAEVPKELTEVS